MGCFLWCAIFLGQQKRITKHSDTVLPRLIRQKEWRVEKSFRQRTKLAGQRKISWLFGYERRHPTDHWLIRWCLNGDTSQFGDNTGDREPRVDSKNYIAKMEHILGSGKPLNPPLRKIPSIAFQGIRNCPNGVPLKDEAWTKARCGSKICSAESFVKKGPPGSWLRSTRHGKSAPCHWGSLPGVTPPLKKKETKTTVGRPTPRGDALSGIIKDENAGVGRYGVEIRQRGGCGARQIGLLEYGLNLNPASKILECILRKFWKTVFHMLAGVGKSRGGIVTHCNALKQTNNSNFLVWKFSWRLVNKENDNAIIYNKN